MFAGRPGAGLAEHPEAKARQGSDRDGVAEAGFQKALAIGPGDLQVARSICTYCYEARNRCHPLSPSGHGPVTPWDQVTPGRISGASVSWRPSRASF